MKNISKAVLLVVALFCASAFGANQAVLTWVPPTVDINGSPIVDPMSFNVYQGIKGQTKSNVQNVTGATLTIGTGLLSGRSYCWELKTLVNSLESVASNEACKDFPAVAPTPSSALTVK